MTRITKNGRLQQKTDLESNWEANDPDILKGEVCVSVIPNDQRKAKVKVATRDGKWSEFDYIGGEGGGGESLWQNGMNEHGLSIKDSKAVVMGNYSAAIGNDVFSNASNSLTVGDYRNQKITFGIDFEEEIDSNTFLYKIDYCQIFYNTSEGEKFLKYVSKNSELYFTSYDNIVKKCVIIDEWSYEEEKYIYFIKSLEGDLINGYQSGTTSISSGIQDMGQYGSSDNSISVGNSNTILDSSNRSSAFGSGNVIFKSVQSFTNGTDNLISESNCANAFGYGNKIRQNCNAFVSGESNVLERDFPNNSSFATGVRNEVYGGYASHIEGYENRLGQTKVYNNGSLEYVNSQADFGHVEGFRNTVGATGAHAEGRQNLASGSSAHAEGGSTTASGENSHAENSMTLAYGLSSHAEGGACIAYAQASHAEGGGSIAFGFESHAEGKYTNAIGQYSHAENDNTFALGQASHTEGRVVTAYGQSSHAEGEGYTSNLYGSVIELKKEFDKNYSGYLTSTIFFNGQTTSVAKIIYESGLGNGILFIGGWTRGTSNVLTPYCNEKAYDNGEIQSLHNNIVATLRRIEYFQTLGDAYYYQGAFYRDEEHTNLITPNQNDVYRDITDGLNVEYIYRGTSYMLLNSGNEYYRYLVQIETEEDLGAEPSSLSFSNMTLFGAGGYASHSEGCKTIASGYASHAEGQENIASSYGSHVEGCRSIANGYASHAEGFNTLASGYASHAGGDSCKAIGRNSAVLTGTSNIAEGENSSVLSGVRNKTMAANSSILAGSDSVIGEQGYYSSILTGHIELIAGTQFILNEPYTAYAYNLWSYNKLYVGDENNRFNLASLAPFTYTIEDITNLADTSLPIVQINQNNKLIPIIDSAGISIPRTEIASWLGLDTSSSAFCYWVLIFNKAEHKKDIVSNVLCLEENGRKTLPEFVIHDNSNYTQEVVILLSTENNTTNIKKVIIS